MNLGPAEIIIVAVVALILLGPNRLPGAARQAGRAMREIQSFTDDFKKAFDEGTDEAPKVDLRDSKEVARAQTDSIPMMPPSAQENGE